MNQDQANGGPPRAAEKVPSDVPASGSGNGQGHAELASLYRDAAASDAHHQRAGGGPGRGGQDPTLVPTPEVPGVPLTDVAAPDPADGQAKGYKSGNSARAPSGFTDAELSGLESGDMI
jgi:hypothetical protein